jgi:hypothetical protein
MVPARTRANADARPTGEVVTYPAPAEEPGSPDYEVWANDKPVAVYTARTLDPPFADKQWDFGGPYSFANFDMSGKVTVRVAAKNRLLTGTVIQPQSLGLAPQRVDDHTITIELDRPRKLSIEPAGKKGPLLLFANPLETDVPKPDAQGVVYFGPGVHKPEKIVLNSNQTLYLAGGAVVKAEVLVEGENIRIHGRGILDGSEWAWRSGPVGNLIAIRNSRHVEVSGITLRGSSHWTIVPRNSQHVTVRGVKLCNSRVQNDDGINPCNSQEVLITDCFIRSDDDCVALKGLDFQGENSNVERITVENSTLWCDRARIFLLGHESRAAFMRDITLRNLDIIHFTMTPFLFEPGEEMCLERVRVEDVRIQGEGQHSLIRLQPVVNQYMRNKVPGRIRDVTFRDVTVSGAPGDYLIQIAGADAEHDVRGVAIENLTIGTERIRRDASRVQVGEHATDVSVSEDLVDFRYAPPEWQTVICFPDDPQKSLVDRSGELLYQYNQAGREFATRVGVEVTADAKWQKQELHSPRVPIVRTFRTAEGLEILEEAFAVAELSQPSVPAPVTLLMRLDNGGTNRNWAQPPAGLDPSLAHIAVHMGGNLQFELTAPAGGACRVAMALCEGYWQESGKRIQRLRVEGAESRTVDTVADIGWNRAAAFWFDARDTNGDGRIAIDVEAAPEAADKNTILNGLWAFASDANPDDDALLQGSLTSRALAHLNAIKPGGPARNDLILVHVTNTGASERTLQPQLIVDTALPLTFQPEAQRLRINDHETITTSLTMINQVELAGSRQAIQLAPLTVPAGQTVSFFALYCGGGSIVVEPATLEQAVASRDRAIAFWERAPLPLGRVQVPDPGIQALVDSSIRNIWQAREIKKGLPAFQVGPTCYRGLWIVDGAFLLEAAAIVGAGKEARSGVAYELTFQQPDGRIEVMGNFSKENGIVLWTCVRHAQLTQDKEWLESVWPKLQRVAEHIQTLRQRTLQNDTPLDDGLVPPGFPDGGIGGVHVEYTNPYWNLLGLRAFIQAAHWLGKTEEAAHWQQEYDAFLAAFRRAAARDMTQDRNGNAYVPIIMGEPGRKELPQRGQWAFCHAVYPGQVFARDDALVASTMAMLAATEREGMVFGTGWDAAGIWNYFASFYGHAWLWQGKGHKASRILYAFANHAAPTGVWREEQSLLGEKFRKVGDMPHNWASAEFLRLTVHLLALDRGDELHLLEGFPRAWAGPGMVTRLQGIATPFGPLEMQVQADRDGKTATLEVQPLATNCRAIVVHLPDGSTRRLPPQNGGSVTFPLD